MHTRSLRLAGSFTALLLLLGLVIGCAQQPYGYVFTPQHRDQVNAAQQAATFISALYDHMDQASSILSDAGLTTDYISVLPEGWVDVTAYDSTGHPLSSQYTYVRNYLDRQYFGLAIPRTSQPGAIRNPSSLIYSFVNIASVENGITKTIYGQADQVRRIELNYADNNQNTHFVEGWFAINRTLPFEQEIQIPVGNGRNFTYTYNVYLPVSWNMKVTKFSIDANDQQGQIVIDGVFPIMDKTSVIQNNHISGVITVLADGTGGGDIWLAGQPVARLSFTGRTFGFQGTFTLFSEDNKTSYSLTN